MLLQTFYSLYSSLVPSILARLVIHYYHLQAVLSACIVCHRVKYL